MLLRRGSLTWRKRGREEAVGNGFRRAYMTSLADGPTGHRNGSEEFVFSAGSWWGQQRAAVEVEPARRPRNQFAHGSSCR